MAYMSENVSIQKRSSYELINSQRKLHDSWALILYVLSLIIVLGFGIGNLLTFNSEKNGLLNEIIINRKNFVFNLLINFVLLIGFLITTLILCRLIPKFLIYSMIVFSILSSICLAFLSNNTSVIILSCIYVMVTLVFLYVVHKNIDYIAGLLVSSSFIIQKFFFYLFLVALVAFGYNIGIMSLCSLVFFTKASNATLYTIVGLSSIFLFWSFSVTFFIIKVLTSSIVSDYLVSSKNYSKNKIVLKSIKNTALALGSICFAALIVAIVKFLQLLNNNLRSNNNNRRRSLSSEILSFIFGSILSILSSIIEHLNDIVFPYLAIYGTSYKDSVYNSFYSISNDASKKMAAKGSISTILSFFTFFYFLFASVINFLILNQNVFEHMSDGFLIIFLHCLFFIFPFVFFCHTLLSTLNDAVMSLILMKVEFEKDVKNYDSKTDKISGKLKEIFN